MRGKHGKAAETRRDWAELEQRATTAEHQAERLEKELAELRETSQRQISGLRAELTQACKDRDAAASPELARLSAQLLTKAAELDRQKRVHAVTQKGMRKFIIQMKTNLVALGMGSGEANDALIMASGGLFELGSNESRWSHLA